MSVLEVLGDVLSLVTTRPLQPAVRMPGTALAWRADPPQELHAVGSTARQLAATLYAQQQEPG